MQLEPEAAKTIRQLIQDMKAIAGPNFTATLVKLEAEVERLTTEIEVLKMCGPAPAIEDDKWFNYHLTQAETRFMVALERAGASGASRDRIMATTYGDQVKDWPGDRILDIRLFHIRTKLEAANAPYWIETIHGTGWRLHHNTPKTVLNAMGKKRWCRNATTARVPKPTNSIAA